MVIKLVNRLNYITEFGELLKEAAWTRFSSLLVKVCYTSALMGRSEKNRYKRTTYFFCAIIVFWNIFLSYLWVAQRVGVGGYIGSSLYLCVVQCWHKIRVYYNVFVIQSPFIHSFPLNVLVLKSTWVA